MVDEKATEAVINTNKPNDSLGSIEVWNATRKTRLVAHLELATTPWARFKGLMGRPELPAGHGLWLEPCSDIHSCFMRFAFDAAFLDKNGKVLHVIHAMKPWRMSRWVWGTRTILELPAGTLNATETLLGDVLERRG